MDEQQELSQILTELAQRISDALPQFEAAQQQFTPGGLGPLQLPAYPIDPAAPQSIAAQVQAAAQAAAAQSSAAQSAAGQGRPETLLARFNERWYEGRRLAGDWQYRPASEIDPETGRHHRLTAEQREERYRWQATGADLPGEVFEREARRSQVSHQAVDWTDFINKQGAAADKLGSAADQLAEAARRISADRMVQGSEEYQRLSQMEMSEWSAEDMASYQRLQQQWLEQARPTGSIQGDEIRQLEQQAAALPVGGPSEDQPWHKRVDWSAVLQGAARGNFRGMFTSLAGGLGGGGGGGGAGAGGAAAAGGAAGMGAAGSLAVVGAALLAGRAITARLQGMAHEGIDSMSNAASPFMDPGTGAVASSMGHHFVDAALGGPLGGAKAALNFPANLMEWTQALIESKEHLRAFSGTIQMASSLAELRTVQRQIESGQRTGGSVSALSDAYQDLLDSTQDIKDAMSNALTGVLYVGTRGLEALITIVRYTTFLVPIATTINWIAQHLPIPESQLNLDLWMDHWKKMDHAPRSGRARP